MSRSGPRLQVLVAAATLIALGAGSPAAQEPAPPTPTPADALMVSAGTNVNGFDHILGHTTRGATVQLGYERRIGGATSPFALRLTGDYWTSGGHTLTAYNGIETVQNLPSGASTDVTTYRRTTTIADGGLFGVWHFPALGPVRSYARAGGGVYHYHATNQTQPSGGPGFI